jgi:hypothetical protein
MPTVRCLARRRGGAKRAPRTEAKDQDVALPAAACSSRFFSAIFTAMIEAS